MATMKKLKYKGYEYAPIEITASHSIDSKIATIECRDTNATGEITFSYTSDKEKEFELRAKIDSVKPMAFSYRFLNTTICSFVMVDAFAPVSFVGEFCKGITLLIILRSTV